jgi:pantoate--beta-alanine ligase
MKHSMRTFASLQDWRDFRKSDILTRKSIGFVPTMGALHRGHRALLERARAESDFVVLSIYINPTQFNSPDDLKNYPQTLQADLDLALACQVDAVLLPSYEEIYPDRYRYKMTENAFSHLLCGAHRPGHFDGVLTIVLKLLNLVRPTRTYFGEKDYQQLYLIKGMVENLFIDTEIIGCQTVREADGLALSSRNVRLTEAERAKACALFNTISQVKNSETAAATLASLGFKVEYVQDLIDRRFAAATLGTVRLIDNIPWKAES